MNLYALFVVSAIGLVVGCENGGDAGSPIQVMPNIPLGTKPGTRLTPKPLLADDGTIFFDPLIWIDSETNVECSFRNAEDGMYRCLPHVPTQANKYYADPKCTQPAFVYRTDMCVKPDKLVLQADTFDFCGLQDRWSLYRITSASVSAVAYIINGDGICAETYPFPNGSEGDLMIMGEKLDGTAYVSAWR